jgi:hypothetical protein
MQTLSIEQVLEVLGFRNRPLTMAAWRRSFPNLRASVEETLKRELERVGSPFRRRMPAV